MTYKINGPELIGFGDFFSGYDNVGWGGFDEVGARPTGRPARGAKGGKLKVKIPYPSGKRSQTVQQHGKVLKKAHGTAHKAALIVAHAQHSLSQKPFPVRTPVVASPRAATVARALPGRAVHVGAAVAAKMTAKQQAAVTKHNAAVAKVKKANQVLAQHALKTKKSLEKLAKHMTVQKKAAVALRKPQRAVAGRPGRPGRPAPARPGRPPARSGAHVGDFINDPLIGDEVAEALVGYYEAVGQAPDPNNPGYLDDGSPDPAYASTDPSLDVGLGDPALDPIGMDSGAELGPAPDMDTFFPDMTLVGGIAYNGAKGTPEGYVGSLHLFDRATDIDIEPNTAEIEGNAHFGYVWGLYGKDNGGVSWGAKDSMPGVWNYFHGRHYLGDTSWVTQNVPAAEAFASHDKNADVNAPGVNGGGAAGWRFASLNPTPLGPLVGNPFYKDFARMRVDGAGNMFWLPQEAPDWLTFPLKQAAALTAKAEAEAAAAAAKADAAAAAKAAADAAAAQAAQDAANALAESQAASSARVSQQEETTKQAQAETEAQQSLVQQQQQEGAAQQVEYEQEKEAGQLLLQSAQQQQAQDQQVQDLLLAQAKREEEYLAQHPEEEFAPPSEEEASYEDGVPLPGGDLLQDAGGEGYQDEEQSDDDLLSQGGDEG